MLPRLSPQELVSPLYQEFAKILATKSFTGDINFQYGARLAHATDNSIYQQLPQLVLHPRSKQDIQIISTLGSEAQFNEIKFSARGGGTGTNGQSLTPGIVVDLSKYMNRILEINVAENWVRVEAGVIKDQLNDYLKPYGFFFSPDLSTSNRATIGGMINTDASGQGSLVYGKTSDHVLGLESVLANGELLATSPMPMAAAQELAKQTTTVAKLMQQVLSSCHDNRALILEKFPRLNRFLTGYDLENVFNDDLSIVDLSRIITGSEGSLAFVCEAKLNLTAIANAKTLINIKYDSFDSALRHSPRLVEAKATSVETIDSKVLNLAKQDIVWQLVSDMLQDVDGATMDGINMVEYNGDSVASVAKQVTALCAELDKDIANKTGVIGYQVTSDLASIGKLYTMRKKAVGLLGNTKGSQKPLAFAEDTAVPPENLADFIVEFRALLDGHGLHYGMFGHVDAGVLHVRPALDMCDPEQEILLRKISDKVVALTAKYGGLMWGEHGKGYRSEYGPEFFGATLFTELRKIKAAFDPLNKMNPGKICTPYHSTEKLVSVDDKKRGFYDRQIPITVKKSFNSALDCNGNGLCFNYDVNSPMCPSSKVTRDRRHSPKGRAGLMREWLRLVEAKGVDVLALEQNIQNWSVKRLLDKVKNRFNSQFNVKQDDDFSHEVMEAMQGCLACKACASQCPIKVDVPDFRARFINLYHSRYFRPLKDHLVANVESMTPIMAKAPKIVNGVLSSNIYDKLSRASIGYVDTPLLSIPTLEQRTTVHQFSTFDLSQLKAMPSDERAKSLLIVQDPFTSFYDAKVVEDFMLLVSKLGFQPILLPFKPNGKPQHVKGFLAKFAKTAKSTADFLNQVYQLNMPMVGLDASLALCFRDEYKQVLGDNRGEFEVQLAHEWLITIIDHQNNSTVANAAKRENIIDYKLFAHCTEKTALAGSEGQWQRIFQHFGLSLSCVAVGCCGMAGTYGHEKVNLDNSKALYQMSWQDKVANLATEQILVTGYSCRSQIKRLDNKVTLHPVQALLNAI
ncbi:FAD-binding oxidoreductase [Colwellia sp. M166]|uniref:D-2-hydroxyglutarate dehydrogenase YdiJ n=1 Tax=Colwellia sp. M166 TaxID=2583805 RepID=UPI00211EAD12|nr:FAD-binding and (Fe-S)-binding domain-containing protein [Colwellia sp. M166]UUO22157.1 FAD-binding oxidoreductase [Colwellia sp. M166]|tara:strand:+ start:66940 stop:70014 length:3075 start_codon:yes stop_codon:yes gene_type:complete